MRRMLTETEVEKLDSIKPSEIEKLGKITDADIESVKAMQSPKNATANYVLTAVAGGKAEYKAPSGGDQYGIKFNLDTSEHSATINTDVYGYYELSDGAHVSIRDIYPTSSVKRVLGIISPNFAYLKINDVVYPANQFSYSYGDNHLTVHLSKEFCSKNGITNGMTCYYKMQPALLCVLK